MKNLKYLAGLPICLYLTACGDNDHFKDLKLHIEQVKAAASSDQSQKASPLPTPPTATTYTAFSRTPFSVTTKSASKKPSGTHPLQTFSISVLRFVGTIHQRNTVIAYILAPDNKVYQVKEGDLIGDQYGKITQITADKIDIMEPSANNSHQQRLVTLQIKEGNP